MSEVQTVETLQRKPQYIEDLEKGIFDSLFYSRDPDTGDYQLDEEGNKIFGGLLGGSQYQDLFKLPDYQVAGLNPNQQRVYDTLGSDEYLNRYQPYFDQAQTLSQQGSDAMSRGLGYVDSATGAFDPSTAVEEYMNPYKQQVIDNALAEINRQSDIQRSASDMRAYQSGAFGGARSGVERAETEGRVTAKRNETIGNLLSQGYDKSLNAAMSAFEANKGRNLKAGQLYGSVGQGLGQMGAGLADVGRVYGSMSGQDMSALSTAGNQQNAYDQTVLDADRANQLMPLKTALAPLTIGAQFISGSPSAGTADQYTQTVTPSPNPFLQGVGAAATMQGLYG